MGEPSGNLVLVLLGTKIDLVHLNTLNWEDVETECKMFKIKYFEISSLNAHNIIKSFNWMMEKVARKVEKNAIKGRLNTTFSFINDK